MVYHVWVAKVRKPRLYSGRVSKIKCIEHKRSSEEEVDYHVRPDPSGNRFMRTTTRKRVITTHDLDQLKVRRYLGINTPMGNATTKAKKAT